MGKIRDEKERRTRSDTQAPYTRTCKCLAHDPTIQSPLSNTSGKDLRKTDLNWLIDNNLLSKRAKWVCRKCLEFGRQNFAASVAGDIEQTEQKSILKDNDNDNTDGGIRHCISDLLELLKNDDLNDVEKDVLFAEWCLHGSKTSIALSGTSTPSGSVTTLKSVLKTASVEKNKCPSKDLDCFFDNTQRIGKTRRVREGGVTPVNVATNVVFCQNEHETDIQFKEEYKPGAWRVPFTESSDKIIDRDDNLYKNVFRPYRLAFIENTIKQVENELVYDDNSDEYKDHVTFSRVLADRNPLYRICKQCRSECLKSWSICPKCSYDCNVIDREELYGDIPNGFESRGVVQTGEIIGVNPNSRESVQVVLDSLAVQCGISEDRKWVRIGCDGVPYNLLLSLINNVYVCSACGERVDKTHSSFEKHLSEKHGQVELGQISFEMLYDFVLPIPGAGHMEINLFRAIFSLTRFIFMEHLAEKLGFVSKKAREFIIGCGDHHLTWQLFQVALYSISSELCRVYVVHCFRQNTKPSADGFVTWVNNVENPNIVLMYHIVFTFLLAMKCFRSGVRRNNSTYMLAGRQAVVPVMFVKKHTIYQKLICSDMSDRVSAPSEVGKYIEKRESFTQSGDFMRCEGGDYVTENVNRSIKNQLPPGVPTLQSWVTASRCNSRLESVRKRVFENTMISESSSERGMVNVTNEVQMFRSEIRKSGWFANPQSQMPLVSLTNGELHPELVNVTHNSKTNYLAFLRGQLKEQLPIFVTPQDEVYYNDARNWTVAKLKEKILSLINNIVDSDLAEFYSAHFKKHYSNANKTSHITLYQELNEIIQNGVQDVDLEVDIRELEG